MLFVTPDGEVHHYDKRHLFSLGGEDKLFTAGSERLVVEYMGWRICPLVCYDLRFPVWSRNRGDYDLLIYTANWPAARSNAWSALLHARAIENQCYVAGCNRVGKEPSEAEYAGHSVVVDFRGDTVAAGTAFAEDIVTAVPDRHELELFREKFPVWRDADSFSL